jgi:hypothetical protein
LTKPSSSPSFSVEDRAVDVAEVLNERVDCDSLRYRLRFVKSIALFGGACDLLTPRRARDVAHPGRQRLENRVEALHRLIRAADHQAVATLQAHHASARAHIYMADLLRREFLGPENVVHVVGVAAVDEEVAGLEMGQDVGDELLHKRPRNHHPDRRGFSSFLTRSASEEAPTAFSCVSSSTASGDLSKTTHCWSPWRRRRTMFAPILPSPIIPICMAISCSESTV